MSEPTEDAKAKLYICDLVGWSCPLWKKEQP
jgi:hypothetical protein